MSNNNDIDIEITGGTTEARAYVGGVVHNALRDNGFTELALNVEGLEEAGTEELVTLLDVINQYDPDFLTSNINIISVVQDDDDELVEEEIIEEEDDD